MHDLRLVRAVRAEGKPHVTASSLLRGVLMLLMVLWNCAISIV